MVKPTKIGFTKTSLGYTRINREALRKAVNLAGEKHGSCFQAARAMGFTKDVIKYWRGTKGIALESVGRLCKEIDFQVTKEEILPDFDWSIFA